MRLREVLAGAAVIEYAGDSDVEVSELAYDDREVTPGTLYFCVPGGRADGHDFAPAAVDAGASALVVERRLNLSIAQARVASARAAMGPAAACFFGEPTRELALVGITGTNGKTTAAFLVRHLLESAGKRTGLLGTVKRVVGGVDEEVVRTTPEAIDLQRTFRRMVDAGDAACAMEVSSHALALGRIAEVDFDVAAFTNLTQDHLDFHRDMDDYFLAKRRLFGLGGDAAASPRQCVVNVDDPFGVRLAAELRAERPDSLVRISPSGLQEADLSARDASFDASGSRFRIAVRGEEVEAGIPLPGHFNVANALVAVAAACCLGVPLADAAAALATSPPVPGRLEAVGGDAPFTVLVDYAHTPDSLRGVLEAARRLAPGRLIAMFGAGGDRDRAKRPLMGAIAARLADVAVVTSDNPRSEDPDAIIAAILGGIERDARAEVLVEPDRRAAIARALAEAAAGDIVVIAGKGHEQGQEFVGGRKVPFDDREVARAELERLRAGGRVG
jgi:UDP-N-acetylmuramoyl-L-alanyl-D-glutamate--2,6-diaminopimelate ligase